ncbi:MAG: 4'-phosphopantetheinyl transferase superfamily protein [Clostridia bacterium]|nr:4'-phosphopantetheinyl transferase superfamily protein [Clostridia bacterium]
MIQLFGARAEELPCEEAMKEQIGDEWFSVWKERHPNLRGEAARLSLGGLLLLRASGADESLLYTQHGRPCFTDSSIDFSITHTGEMIFCAVSKNSGRVGLDAEDLSRVAGGKISALSARWFGEEELKVFSENASPREFLRLWTRKEAYVKRTGEGLRQMRQIDTYALRGDSVSFLEYWIGDTCVTLCVNEGAEVCEKIDFLD